MLLPDTIKKHVARLRTLTRKNRGVLPTYRWLNDNGFFHSYKVARVAGKLSSFKRAVVKNKKSQ
jgi:hypothetical protein